MIKVNQHALARIERTYGACGFTLNRNRVRRKIKLGLNLY